MDEGLAAPAAVEVDVESALGPGRLTITVPEEGAGPRGVVVLGHGAGGRSWSPDLRAVAEGARTMGWAVALADQPWRLAGRKVADRPEKLDRAWPDLVAAARARFPHGQLVVGGRSAGARVACRTAASVGADAVLCLSFPLHPPGRPEASRAAELALPVAARRPVLVVQGARDPFGTPQEIHDAVPELVDLVTVPGTHTLTSPSAVSASVTAWLVTLGR